MIRCLVDQTDHPTLEALHKHLRKLKVKQETYYTEWAPRRDLGSGEIIPFKAPVDRYLKAEFVDKNALKRFLKEQPEAGRRWAADWLRKRKVEKALTYPPTQTELRSLMAPTVRYCNHAFPGGYASVCRGLGYTVRFDGAVPVAGRLGCEIIVDTREQDPLKIKHPTVKGTIRCGDYGLPVAHDRGIYIERKSLPDFVGTLSDRETRQGDSNLARFTRELERAEETGNYVVMLVESDINQALGFNHLPHMQHGKIRPEHVFKNLRELLQRFTAFQALFVKGRVEAAAAVVRLLEMGDAVKTIDLEAAYEEGELTFV